MNDKIMVNAASDLVHLPFESLVSSLWRFAWRNALPPNLLSKYCARSPCFIHSISNSLYRRFEPELFRASSGWNVPVDEASYGIGVLPQDNIWWEKSFRYCPLCLEHGYHSFWHQSKFLECCPFDGALLRAECYWCGHRLPDYGFTHKLFSEPYCCSSCHKPIAGPSLTVQSRLAYQEHAHELDTKFSRIDQWWHQTASARVKLERLLPRSSPWDFFPWSRPDRSFRAWLCEASNPPNSVCWAQVPRLVHMSWKVWKPVSDLVSQRRSSTQRGIRRHVANKVYRATLRYLERLINEYYPFVDADYKRYLRLPDVDIIHSSQCYNPYLHALCFMRRQLEPVFSRWQTSAHEGELKELPGFRCCSYVDSCNIRICWRAHFIALYAMSYWRVNSARRGRGQKKVFAEGYSGDILHFVENSFVRDWVCTSGESAALDHLGYFSIEGHVAFPAVDGLNLNLLRTAKSVKC